MNVIRKILHIIGLTNWIFFIFCALCLIVLFGMMLTDVLGRIFLNRSLTGISEYSRYLVVSIGFLGLGYAQIRGRHVRATIVTRYLSQKINRTLSIITLLIATGFFIIMTRQVASVAYTDLIEYNITSQSLVKIPIWGISAIAALGCVLLICSLLVEVTQKIFNLEESQEE